ncbi:hypothetical protein MPH_11566, partial [Macrophomina phaseolina MS6]
LVTRSTGMRMSCRYSLSLIVMVATSAESSMPSRLAKNVFSTSRESSCLSPVENSKFDSAGRTRSSAASADVHLGRFRELRTVRPVALKHPTRWRESALMAKSSAASAAVRVPVISSMPSREKSPAALVAMVMSPVKVLHAAKASLSAVVSRMTVPEHAESEVLLALLAETSLSLWSGGIEALG